MISTDNKELSKSLISTNQTVHTDEHRDFRSEKSANKTFCYCLRSPTFPSVNVSPLLSDFKRHQQALNKTKHKQKNKRPGSRT